MPERQPRGKGVTVGTFADQPTVGELRYHDSLGPVIIVRRRLDGRLVVRKADDEKEAVVLAAMLREHPRKQEVDMPR
jgi:hypothetical protein